MVVRLVVYPISFTGDPGDGGSTDYNNPVEVSRGEDDGIGSTNAYQECVESLIGTISINGCGINGEFGVIVE
jgi:hypothetical protein